MLRIDDTIFSFNIFEKKFECNLGKCHGNCCLYGDSGAPLSDSEARILDEIWPVVKPFLRPEGIDTIEKLGTSITDFEYEKVTPLINNKECAYTILKGNIFMCGIEQAWADGKIAFQKPLSCHLFPVRIKQFTTVRAVNYEELAICSSALDRGCKKNIYVYEFLKEPLIRALGEEMYSELCSAAAELRKNGTLI